MSGEVSPVFKTLNMLQEGRGIGFRRSGSGRGLRVTGQCTDGCSCISNCMKQLEIGKRRAENETSS